MAYVFDYINNTLIDDEDKSLGNKLGLMDGGRVNFDNGSNPFIDIEDLNKKLQQANINRQMGSIDFFINKFGEDLLNKITQEKFGIDFRNVPVEKDDPKGTIKNFKRRLIKFENFI